MLMRSHGAAPCAHVSARRSCVRTACLQDVAHACGQPVSVTVTRTQGSLTMMLRDSCVGPEARVWLACPRHCHWLGVHETDNSR
eukprot:292116-Prymnesium_polylepis.1